MSAKQNETVADKQHRVIQQARLLLEPEVVRLHKTPRWLSKAITAYWKKRGFRRPSVHSLRETLSDVAATIGISIRGNNQIDHWGTVTGGPWKCCHDAKECYVSEPYGFDLEFGIVLEAFCKEMGLEWHVSPNSWWFPGTTIRITIHPRTEPTS